MRFRWSVVLGSIAISLFMLFRPALEGESWSLENIKKNIRLGLDLRGGIYMQLEVDVDDAVHQYLEEQAGTIKAGLLADQIECDLSVADPAKTSVELKNVRSVDPEIKSGSALAAKVKERYSGYWNITNNGQDFSLRLKEGAKTEVQNDAVSQTVFKIQNRVDQLGVTEPNITRALGSNRIIIELAGADDVERVHTIVREPGKLEWRLVEPNFDQFSTEQEALAKLGGQIPPGKKLFPYPGVAPRAGGFLLLQEVLLTAGNIANVYETVDDQRFPAVGINLDRAGAQIFSQSTKNNVGNRLAVILDGQVIIAPVIQQELNDRFIINGIRDQREVRDLVIKIKSGSLPAEVKILEERVIGPTLGRDAIQQGFLAAALGLLIVVFFILLYYRRAGVYAVMALTINLILILGMISFMGAVLTLPGIAGFILTIGMAVDANVLVFERVREELRSGAPPRASVETGYKAAFVTIMDANITTFIAAFCLLLLGQGPVKGFAVMLMIGIVCSIFTAVFCSRTFFLAYLNRHTDLKNLSIWPVWRKSPELGTT